MLAALVVLENSAREQTASRISGGVIGENFRQLGEQYDDVVVSDEHNDEDDVDNDKDTKDCDEEDGILTSFVAKRTMVDESGRCAAKRVVIFMYLN